MGVRIADLERIAKSAGNGHGFAMSSWATRILDARFLSTKVMDAVTLTRIGHHEDGQSG
jgi:hypothetical protein